MTTTLATTITTTTAKKTATKTRSHLYRHPPGLRLFLDQLVRFGFAIVDGAEATPEGTRVTAERLCFVQTTTFGDIWTFTADMKVRKDTRIS